MSRLKGEHNDLLSAAGPVAKRCKHLLASGPTVVVSSSPRSAYTNVGFQRINSSHPGVSDDISNSKTLSCKD